MHTDHDQLHPAFGFTFEDLYSRQGLVRVDAVFCHNLQAAEPALFQKLIEARKDPGALARKQQSELIIAIAPHLEDFIGELFGIPAEVRALQAKHDALAPLYALKRKFIQKKAISGMTAEKAAAITADGSGGGAGSAVRRAADGTEFRRARLAVAGSRGGACASNCKAAQQYAAWAALSPAGRHKHQHGVLFQGPA